MPFLLITCVANTLSVNIGQKITVAKVLSVNIGQKITVAKTLETYLEQNISIANTLPVQVIRRNAIAKPLSAHVIRRNVIAKDFPLYKSPVLYLIYIAIPKFGHRVGGKGVFFVIGKKIYHPLYCRRIQIKDKKKDYE